MYLLNLARARSSPQFWHFNPEPNFPKNLPLFGDFHPEPHFPKNLPQFWDFSRIQTLGTFVLRFARARSSPQFWHFNPEPNFPKNLPLFWDFHPEPNFPKNLPQFWDFSRIQTLGTFVLRFRYFEFTACDCRSLEFTIGPTNISSLLVVGTSVFLVPLTLRWKKAADIVSPS